MTDSDSSPRSPFFSAAGLGILLTLLLIPFQSAWAESAADEESAGFDCHVGVRLISAKRSGDREPRGEIRLQSILSDMSDQLVVLPFSDYRRVDNSEAQITFNKRSEFTLKDEAGLTHRIFVCPHHFVGKYIHAAVDWRGPNGETIVSTKMRIRNRQNVVLGADDTSSSSTIVGIKLDCKE